MKEIFKVSKKEKEEIIKGIKQSLEKRKEIVFAYVYGSFLNDPSFRDIDIGVYLKKRPYSRTQKSFDYVLDLGVEIGEEIGQSFLIDVRLLNQTPFHFLNNVFARGRVLFSRDNEFLANLMEKICLEYLRYRPFAEQYLKERINLNV